jgi:AcrR family transcriptional regulator
MARRVEASADPGMDQAWRHCHPLELSPILAAALEAFDEKGFHGATVRDIARRVGQTVPALYYHHENKEAMFVALQDLGVDELNWRVKTAVKAAGSQLAGAAILSATQSVHRDAPTTLVGRVGLRVCRHAHRDPHVDLLSLSSSAQPQLSDR